MQAEHLVLNDGRQGEEVKQLGKLLPYVRVSVLAKALIVETVPKSLERNQLALLYTLRW